MTIKSVDDLAESGKKIEIDLTGPDGNAFALLGKARNMGKQLGMTELELSDMTDDMTSSDYEHLVQVFDSYFGDYVDLYR